MSRYLVDTNVISELVKPLPAPEVLAWFEGIDHGDLFSSVISWGEVYFGISSLSPGRRRTELERWLRDLMPAWFRDHLLPVSREVAQQWGVLSAETRRQGRAPSTPDGLIAATAFVHDLVLVTRDERHLSGLGVTVFNPWNEAVKRGIRDVS